MNVNYLGSVGITLLANSPMVLAWVVGIVLTVLMIRRGGGKAEKLLLTGCAVMFVDTLYISVRKGIRVILF